MQVLLSSFFREYDYILAWKTDAGWKLDERVHACDFVTGVPELMGAYHPLIGEFAEGPEDFLDLGPIRWVKSEEDDPQAFNAKPRKPVVQAYQMVFDNKPAGCCYRVVWFPGGEPRLSIGDDADGKLLAVLYGGVPAHVGTDFRFFSLLFQQAAIPGVSLVDVSSILRSTLKETPRSDDVFRIFRSRIGADNPSQP